MINFYNEISRASICDELHNIEELQCLLPTFSLLYGQPNKCYYVNSAGALTFFLQQEGVAQGCTLGPLFSAIALHGLLQPLNTALRARAHQRKASKTLGDDGFGSHGAASAYLDDQAAALCYADLPFTLQYICREAVLRGCSRP